MAYAPRPPDTVRYPEVLDRPEVVARWFRVARRRAAELSDARLVAAWRRAVAGLRAEAPAGRARAYALSYAAGLRAALRDRGVDPGVEAPPRVPR